jgi:putative acyl-CoA dehydrogenase
VPGRFEGDAKGSETIAALRQELASTTGVNSTFDHFVGSLLSAKEIAGAEFGVRRFVEQLALALEASALIRSGNQPIADVFCAARLTGRPGLAFGTLRSEDGVALLLERAQPRVTGIVVGPIAGR